MKTLRKFSLLCLDCGLLIFSIVLAILLRTNLNRLEYLFQMGPFVIIVMIAIKILILKGLSLYDSLWEHASINELIRIFAFGILSNVAMFLFDYFGNFAFTAKSLILISVFDVLLIGGLRFSYRVLRRMKHRTFFNQKYSKRLLIIGAGYTGGMIAKNLMTNPVLHGLPIGFVDDDPDKLGISLNGVRVLGNRNDIFSIVKRKSISEIILAIPSASIKNRKEILEECKRTGCKVKTVPSLEEMIHEDIDIRKIRDVEIKDLLGREEIRLDQRGILGYLYGRTVLVTGGAGSIGSELCRQILNFHPKKLIILDINENAVHELDQDLRRLRIGATELEIIITSIRDKRELNSVFERLKPQVVFHAAAHKHVPLMERCPREAIKNNVFGTHNLVEVAIQFRVERFVMISTDKAVNPTSIMGASKRIGEMIIQAVDSKNTIFTAVRFGNVLGSNGSVIPLFKKQIKEGGPVTVTHKDMIRYFMTIPEASRLVLQAGGLAEGGEIYVLDMGEPVRIIDLAEDLIRLSGFKPYEDIEIVYTGLRPGEKLYEELLTSEETVQGRTSHEKIFIGMPNRVDYPFLLKRLEVLKEVINSENHDEFLNVIRLLVPSYQSDNHNINRAFLENGCVIPPSEIQQWAIGTH